MGDGPDIILLFQYLFQQGCSISSTEKALEVFAGTGFSVGLFMEEVVGPVFFFFFLEELSSIRMPAPGRGYARRYKWGSQKADGHGPVHRRVREIDLDGVVLADAYQFWNRKCLPGDRR